MPQSSAQHSSGERRVETAARTKKKESEKGEQASCSKSSEGMVWRAGRRGGNGNSETGVGKLAGPRCAARISWGALRGARCMCPPPLRRKPQLPALSSLSHHHAARVYHLTPPAASMTACVFVIFGMRHGMMVMVAAAASPNCRRYYLLYWLPEAKTAVSSSVCVFACQADSSSL